MSDSEATNLLISQAAGGDHGAAGVLFARYHDQLLKMIRLRMDRVDKRSAELEVSLYRGPMPEASSASLAAQLLGRLTSPSLAAIRAESQLKIQEALNGMDRIDREILVLRHFEHLSNNETAELLGISKAAASKRYVSALRRLKEILAKIPGFED
jgi:RNA polymerase sigma-70 factor (ECF subfamily)